MEGIPRIGEVISPKLLNLMPNNRDAVRGQEEEKLELRLGPPGEHNNKNNNNHLGGDGNSKNLGLLFSTRSSRNNIPPNTHFDFSIRDDKGDISQPRSCSRGLMVVELEESGVKKPNTTISQKRTAPGPVVGWPPIRSFRKNITTTSINHCPKPPNSPHDVVEPKKLACEKSPVDQKASDGGNYNHQIKRGSSMFVKINMEGVVIGRKVDLGAYDTYDKLSSAVDVLFRDLLAAQRDDGRIELKREGKEEKPITGVLDGRGEYTLVYEDNEGDRMLLGDVPWHMFLSTVKRLRVLKTSELSSLGIGGRQA